MLTPLFRCLAPTFLALFLIAGCENEDREQEAQDYLERAQTYLDQNQYRAAMIEITNARQSAPDEARYRVAMAEVYNTLGASRRASDLLAPQLEEHPQQVALPLTEAYLQQGKFLSAEETLARFEPENAEQARRERLYRADARRLRGELAESESAYQSLLEDYPQDEEIRLRLAQNHIFRGQLEAAESLLDELKQTHPETPRVWQLSAVVAWQRNNPEQAERDLTEALMHVPDSDVMLPERAEILQLLSEALTAQGRTAEALVYSKALSEESPEAVEARQQMREASEAAESGDYARAESILDELLEENPESQSASIMLGMLKLRQGDLEAAEPLLTEWVDAETAGSDMIRAAAFAQAEKGDLEAALETIARSLEARPDNTDLLAMYGTLALNRPETEQDGYLSLQKALAQDPDRSEVRLTLARYHFREDQPEQAMAQLSTGFERNPTDWPLTTVYVNRLLSRNAMDEAQSVVARLREVAPEARETDLLQAQYRFRDGETGEAIDQLRSLTEREPEFIAAHNALAQMYVAEQRHDEALSVVERLAAMRPDNMDVLRTGLQIIQAGELDTAPADWLLAMAERESALRPNAVALSAMIHRQQGKLDRAVALMRSYDGEQTDTIRQTSALVYRDRARELAGGGRYDRARELLQRALETFPGSLSLNLDLVRLDLAQERYEQAGLLLADLRDRHPDNPDVALLNSRHLRATEGPDVAYEALREDWERQPHSALAGRLISLAREQAPEAVPKILQQWEEAAPDDPARLLFMAGEYERQDDEAAAIGAYEQVLAQSPDNPVALNNLAWSLRERDPQRALTLAERAVQQRPESAPMLDTYGWLLHLAGRHGEAVDYLERAAERAPESEEIQANLEAAREAAGGE